MNKSSALSLCLALCVGCTAVAVLSLVLLVGGVRSLGWPQVSGCLLKVNRDQYPASALDYVTARYAYEVAGQRYEGDRICLGCFGPRFKALDLIRAERTSVPVYYNPSKPQQAVLFRGVSPWDYLLPFVFGGFGMLAAYASWRVKKDYDDSH